MSGKLANKSMEPTGASGSAHLQSVRRWPLAPAAHAQRCEPPFGRHTRVLCFGYALNALVVRNELNELYG